MARKMWTEAEIAVLEQRVRDKVQRKEKLTAGETLIADELRHGKPLSVRMMSEWDFYIGFDE